MENSLELIELPSEILQVYNVFVQVMMNLQARKVLRQNENLTGKMHQMHSLTLLIKW